MAKKTRYPSTVGCFDLSVVEPGKWKVLNTLTQYEHCTYGTFEEIKELLEAQTVLWEARKERLGAKLKGMAPANRRSTRSTKYAKAKEIAVKTTLPIREV